ncbi:hypothetical protein ACFQI7_15945 [Paenibacillus allorhizosphaerae]|uniref:Uncharacterized protein n=1 Tax=Paenibacillus allorhizosphaerae TaxID=2849866 RepID=A0ABN7TEW0_9BACL|nr:hypothetical protein [Paenibacillus allorhizosphaerae]CAG7629556.1 hypothetical protein PAECIP111802_01566 [Paenibacillus allorhizosphaerae]
MYRSNKVKWALIFMLAAVPAAGIGPSAVVNAQSEAYQRDVLSAAQQLDMVYVTKNAYFELKNAVILPSENGRMLFFTITVNNGEAKELPFLDYWVRVGSKGGTEFEAQLLPQDKAKKEVPAGQQVDYSFYAPVNDSVTLGDLKFRITHWNYNLAALEETVGAISFPDDVGSVLSTSSGSRTLNFGSFPVEAQVTKNYVQEKEAHLSPRLMLKLTNHGGSSLKLPGLQYSLRTANGALYPLEAIVPADKQLLTPEVSVEFQLKGSLLPKSAAAGEWEVVISQPVSITSDQKLNYPIASLTVPAASMETIPVGSPVEYTNLTGTYRLQVEKLQRMPWEDQDILSADLTLTHQETTSLPFPELKAYFLLDDGVKVEAKAIRTDRAAGLPPGIPMHVQIAAKIPYSYPYSSAKLVVNEKVNEQTTEEMAQFDMPLTGTGLKTVVLGDKQPITGAGRSATYAPSAVNTYSDDTSQWYEVQLETTNMEKRSAALPKVAAFLKTTDDRLFPMKIREVKQKLNPSGKAMQSLIAKLPKDMDTAGLKMVIGEAVTDTHWTGVDEKADAYLNAVEMEIPSENATPKSNLKDIEFFPYKLTLSRIQTGLDRTKLTIAFDYKLERDNYYETVTDGQKLIIQFQDSRRNVTIEEVFYLESKPDDDDKKVDLGLHDYKITKADAELIFRVEQLKQYKISVFSELQGKRKLLASQFVDWFVVLE